MELFMCKSKIHRAIVTEANLQYAGSITIDSDLMKKANIIAFEKVQIVNVNNGSRTETYVIEGEPGSKVICMNGAMARKAQVGDTIIIIAYALMKEDEAKRHKPTVLYVDEHNNIKN